MKSFKSLTLAFCVASFACSTALAETREVSGTLSAQERMNADQARRGGFGTNAKVALWWGDSKILRSLNVSSVTNPVTGVYCITPSVKLNFAKVYPQVTAEASATIGAGFWAYVLNTTNNPIFCSVTQLEVITRSLVGTAVQDSDQVSFYLIVE